MSIIPMILMASALIAALQPGESLPPLKGEFLTGREAQLPDAASGRVALLALGFTYNSRFPVEAWVGRFRKDFGSNPRVTFYEIPMIGGMARLGKWFIDSGMRKEAAGGGSDPPLYEDVIDEGGGGGGVVGGGGGGAAEQRAADEGLCTSDMVVFLEKSCGPATRGQRGIPLCASRRTLAAWTSSAEAIPFWIMDMQMRLAHGYLILMRSVCSTSPPASGRQVASWGRSSSLHEILSKRSKLAGARIPPHSAGTG